MKQFLRNLVHEDSGQDMIEYALVSTLLALSLLAVIRSYNLKIGNAFGGIGTSLTNAIS
jgi:pilus assembly protein Flp/PilA